MNLTTDVMLISGIEFITTSARKIKVNIAKHITNWTASQVSKSLNKAKRRFQYMQDTDKPGVWDGGIIVGKDRSEHNISTR